MNSGSSTTRILCGLTVVGAVFVGALWKWTGQERAGGFGVQRTTTVTQPVSSSAGIASPAGPTSSLPDAQRRRTTASSSWDDEFATSKNYGDLLRNALDAARRGDGRAAFTVSRIMGRCLSTMSYVRSQVKAGADPVPRPASEIKGALFDRCYDLTVSEPFSGLPGAAAQYESALYWVNEAARLKDPWAQATHAVNGLAGFISDARNRGGRPDPEEIRSEITAVIRSADPRGLYTLGLTLTDPRLSGDPTQGAALILAACELGLDCSGQTSLIDSRCEFTTAGCGTIVSQQDLLASGMGSALYARAYSRAQTLLDVIKRQDWEHADEFTELKGKAVVGK